MKWEYKIEKIALDEFGSFGLSAAESQLNDLGNQGWEAVVWGRNPNEPSDHIDTLVLLKRQISK